MDEHRKKELLKVNDERNGRNERILTQKGKERGITFKWKRSKVSNATKEAENWGLNRFTVSQPSALAASQAWSHRALQIKAAYCCKELQNVSKRPPQFLNNGNTAS